MKRTLLVLAFALSLSLAALPAAAQPRDGDLAPLHSATGEVVEGSYIVVMKPGKAAEAAADRVGVRPTHVYRHALNGFAAQMGARQLDAVRRNPNVAWVEHDQVASAVGKDDRRRQGPPSRTPESQDVRATATQFNPPWGLDRIDQRFLPLDNRYVYNTTAPNVDIYVLDTGVDPNHPEFNGKVLQGYDAFGGNSWDCHGHGTHVAGTAAGETYGVAKHAWVWSVRVLDCNGFGSYAGIIAGTDWVRQNAQSWLPHYPPVANYSLGGGASAALNNAVNNLSHSGVFVAVASGNSNADACGFSPAGASTPFTTNATDRNDNRAWFSNYGPCTDGYAPGVDIQSARPGGGSTSMTGTSMASPHVAGIGALYKATFGQAASATVKNWIINNATVGVVNGNPPNTPNRLVYKSSL